MLGDRLDSIEDVQRDQDRLTASLSEQPDTEHRNGRSTPLLTNDDQKISGSPNTTRKHATEWWTEWRLEVLSGVLSIVALVGTVATLEPNQGKPLPQWPFDISVNALLSIYSVVFKICMTFVIQSCISQQQWVWFASERRLYDAALFDSARQGPYGSAVWIWVHHLQQPLTTLGAVIIILSVAVDPFYQQLLHYVDCKTPLQDTATVARSNYFDDDFQAFVDVNSLGSMGFDAQSALRSGLFSKPDAVQPRCSTGNCTFATYSTVGYCSHCRDISEDLKFTSLPVPVDQDWSSCIPAYDNQNYVITSYLPSGFSMIWNTSGKGTPDVLSGRLLEYPATFELIVGKTSFSDLRIDPTTGANRSWCDSQFGLDDDWRCRGYGAATCSLFPCVRTYNTTVIAGSVTESLVEHSTLEILRNRAHGDEGQSRLVLVNTSCVSPDDEQQLLKQGFQTDSRWLVYNTSNDFNPGIIYAAEAAFPGSMLARGCTYIFDDLMLDMSLWNFFSDFLTGNVTGKSTCYHNLISFSGPSELQVLYNSSNVSFQGIQETFDNVATSFTNYMRINGHENYSTPAQGIVWHYATCLEVRWSWITLPVVLAAMTMLCLLPMTVRATLRADVPTWKTGLLPLAFRGPLVHQDHQRQDDDEDHGRAAVSTGNSIRDMEESSKVVRVRLSRVGREISLANVSAHHTRPTSQVSPRESTDSHVE